MMRSVLPALVVALLAATGAGAATYYVDFDSGHDTAAGISAAAAFKHCPGDAAATDKAKAVALAPGDTLLFKGGVSYRGTIAIKTSGQAGKPITYDGNTAGKFGEGQAVIDGSAPLAGWKVCRSAEECGGNSNWKNIYVGYAPKDSALFTVNLCEGGEFLQVAQDPNFDDPFYQDDTRTFLATTLPLPHLVGDSMEYVKADYFTQTDPHYWDGAYFVIMTRPARLQYLKVKGFVPAEHKIIFAAMKEADLYNPAAHPDEARFCMFNGQRLIDRPGEYWFSETPEADGTHKILLWPRKAGPDGPQGVTCSARKFGFDLAGASFVTIAGLRIQKQGGEGAAAIDGGKCSNLTIRDNEITMLCSGANRSGAIRLADVDGGLVDHNRIALNRRCAGLMVSRFNDGVASNNHLHKNGSTAVDYYDCHHSKLLKNLVTEHNGVHANGLTMYVGCTDILVEGNRVIDSNVGLTTQVSQDIVIRYNVFDGAGKNPCIGLWASDGRTALKNITIVNNVCVRAAPNHEWSAAIYNGDKRGSGYVIKNNIIDGLAGSGFPADTVFANNIYTQMGPWQKETKRALGPGELLETDLSKIFVDPAKLDYHLKKGSPAIDAGVDVGLKTDYDGTPVPQGKAPDIGAFEFKP